MLNKKEMEDINYFKDIIAIEQIKHGYKKREKYKIVTKNGNYFFKIHHRKLSQKEIMREKSLYEIYQNLNTPMVPLLELMEYKGRTAFIYPFFEGIDLKQANLGREEYYKYGVKVGEEITKLQTVAVDAKLFSRVNLDDYFIKSQEQAENLWKNDNYQEKILQIFSKEELQFLAIQYKSLLDFVKTQKFLLNHNDIKVANIMLDQQKNHYVVDIDPINLTPSGFNICYSIYSFLLPEFEENEKSFLRGFIQTMDSNREMVKQIQYFLMADMINEAERLLMNVEHELQENKEYMKKMLFNEENFLEKMIYEEK